MKPTTTLALAVCIGAAAFLMGRWNAREAPGRDGRSLDAGLASVRERLSRPARDAGEVAGPLTTAVCEGISAEKAARLTSAERMALLVNGAMVYNSGNQTAVLCDLISTFSKEEIREAAILFSEVQERGNFQTREVWDSLWKQWGRVDPMGCLMDASENAPAKSPGDVRNVMAGWLETDAAAALAWAKEPKQDPLQAAAAALAITQSANGDMERLFVAIASLPSNWQTTRECYQDYFDLASLAGEGQSVPAIYDQLDPSLRAAAWSVAMQRLTYGDPQEAVSWLRNHAGDPGRDYRVVERLIDELADKDPAGTLKWVVELPAPLIDDPFVEQTHPAVIVMRKWQQQDPAAAAAWLKTQPPDAPWALPASQ
jgi:hypothetical protein